MNFSSLYAKFGPLFGNFSFWIHDGDNHDARFGDDKKDFLFAGHEPGTIVLVLLYAFSFITGLVANVTALSVLTRKRNRLSGASTTRKLLINLAACDMLVVCVCMPVSAGHHVHNAWLFGDFLCRAVPFVQAVSVSASVLSLSAISLNRFYAVHSPLRARSFFTSRKILCMILSVWLASSALCAPLIFINRTQTLPLLHGLRAVTVCVESWSRVRMRHGYNFLLFCSLYALPVIFNLVICWFTGRKLWKARAGLAWTHAAAATRVKSRKKIAKMVLALVLLFTVSWLPLYAVDIWIDFNVPSSPDSHVEGGVGGGHEWVLRGRPFAQWLGLTNSALNPLCYCFVGNLYRSAKRFRQSYRKKVAGIFFSGSSSGSVTQETAALSSLMARSRARTESEAAFG